MIILKVICLILLPAIIVGWMLSVLFGHANAPRPTTPTYKITKADGSYYYHTTGGSPTNNWDDVISVEEVKR